MTEPFHSGFTALLWVARAEITVLLAALAGIIGYRLLTGTINTRRLLADASGPISPIRVQLLVSTFLIAGDCLLHRGHLTLVDGTTATVVASGSNLLYLVHKYFNPNRRGNVS